MPQVCIRSNVCHLFPPMLEVVFSFLVHTISGGLSRVASAMSSPTRSCSPMRSGSVQDEKIEEPKENPDAQVGLNAPEGLPEGTAEAEKKESKDANEGLRDELATPAEETAGKQLLEAVVSASRSLTICAKELEKNCSLLSDVKDSAVAFESLTAGVNYYASATKAANSAQSQNHKQIQWDWLSTANERAPMRDVIKSIKTHCENTGKASYELVKTSRMIVDIIQSNNQLMKEQCQMLQVIGENQKQLAEIMKGVIEPPQAGGPPSGGSCGHGGISPPAPGYMPFFPPGVMPHVQPAPAMPTLAPIRAKFWQYQPVVAPNMEPNESRNPPSAAYAAQESCQEPWWVGSIGRVRKSADCESYCSISRADQNSQRIICSQGLDAIAKWLAAQDLCLRLRRTIEPSGLAAK